MGTADPVRCPKCARALAEGARFCDRCGVPVLPAAVDPLSAPPLRVGELLEGKWRLEGKLGAGGMGAVFLARDVALDRKVAIKILAAQLCDDQEFVIRFEREARATAALEHPNVVPVHAVGRHQGRPFIVMKALEGQTLSKLIKSRLAEGRRLGRQEILPLFEQICAGLGFIHEKGCVHRDVKSGNLFVGGDGHVTVLDFGVLRDVAAERITRSGVLVGTPTYASPEQVRGADVDSRADLYAVGVLLFECLTLKAPFVGDPLAVMQQHEQAAPPELEAIAPGLPPAVSQVVKKALAKQPEQRYQTARGMFGALEEAWPESPLARRMALSPETVETVPTRDPIDLATGGNRPPEPRARSLADCDAAETLPADAVFIAEMLQARKPAAAPAAAVPAPPPPSVAAPAPAPAPAPDEADSDWSVKTEPAAPLEPRLRDQAVTVRIRGLKKAQPAPVEAAKLDDPRAPKETTGELAARIRPKRWPLLVAGLAAGAVAAAAAWLQWGPK